MSAWLWTRRDVARASLPAAGVGRWGATVGLLVMVMGMGGGVSGEEEPGWRTFEERVWKVAADFPVLLRDYAEEKGEPSPYVPTPYLRDNLARMGITFPPGAFIEMDAWSGELTVKHAPAMLDRIDELVRAMREWLPFEVAPELVRRLRPERVAPDPEAEKERAWLWIKAKSIILPRVSFENVTLEEAAMFLEAESRRLDTLEPEAARRGIAIGVARRHPDLPELDELAIDEELDAEGVLTLPKLEEVKIDGIELRNVPLATILEYMRSQVQASLQVTRDGLIFAPRNCYPPPEIEEWAWLVGPVVMERLLGEQTAGADGVIDCTAAVRELGIEPGPDATVTYDPVSETLDAKGDRWELEDLEWMLRKAARTLTKEGVAAEDPK